MIKNNNLVLFMSTIEKLIMENTMSPSPFAMSNAVARAIKL